MRRVNGTDAFVVRLLAGLFLFAASVSQWGCTTSRPLLIARSVDVTGPIHQIPVRVTDRNMGGHLEIIPHVAIVQERHLGGKADLNNGVNLTEFGNYDSTGNIYWNLPSYVAGLSLDYGLSKTISLSAGGTYSNVNGKESLEWDAGFALCFQDPGIGGRLEAGVQWQDIDYSALLDRYNKERDLTTGVSTTTYLYTIRRYGRFVAGNFYCSFTLNTKFNKSPVNGFCRIGYGVTSLLTNDMLKVGENGDIATWVGIVDITPGLYFNMSRSTRLLLGCDFISPVGMSSSDPRWMVDPVVQLSFTI